MDPELTNIILQATNASCKFNNHFYL